ncbi:hypothetical protein C8Q74DRAFT_1373077 [Fomes fomentarius]|nr:hypothetical protein C8Q74DRAFT_1373077 [Fomes fomentarius]
MSTVDGGSVAPALTTWSPEMFTRPPTNQNYFATVTHPRPYADSISERGSTDSQDESAGTVSQPSSSMPLFQLGQGVKGSQAQSQDSISTAAAMDEHAYAYEVHTPSATHAPAHAHPSSSPEDLWLRAKQAPSRQS